MRKKQEHYEAINQMANCSESLALNKAPVKMSSYWQPNLFSKEQPLVLELGCGKGEYAVNLAQKNAQLNFLGVDIKGNRLWSGATKAEELNLTNLRFLRMQIYYIEEYFPKNSVSEIWITFPDPFLRNERKNKIKRLTANQYLDKYYHLLKEDGLIHLKTDSQELYNFTLQEVDNPKWQILEKTNDLYNSPISGTPTQIQTTFEKRYLAENKQITYLKIKKN